jgi:FkbM family methyltransferase
MVDNQQQRKDEKNNEVNDLKESSKKLKNPLNLVIKANKSFNLHLENADKMNYLLDSYSADQEKQNSFMEKFDKIDFDRINGFLDSYSRDEDKFYSFMEKFDFDRINGFLDSYSKDMEKLDTFIEDYHTNYQLKKEFFFNGEEEIVRNLYVDTDYFYQMCTNNNIKFLSVLPQQNRIYLKTENDIIVCTNQNFYVLKEVFVNNAYRLPNIYQFEEFVLFDVGMHRGYVSLAIGSMETCKSVYGFEIDEDTYNFALENFSLNPKLSEKIQHYNFGLSNKDEDVEIHCIPTSDGRTTLSSHLLELDLHSSDKEKYTVNKEAVVKKASKVFSDIVLNDNITGNIVLKIDTEGAEYDILDDLSKSGVLDSIDLIIGEFHDGIDKFEKYLQDFTIIKLDYLDDTKNVCTFCYARNKQ